MESKWIKYTFRGAQIYKIYVSEYVIKMTMNNNIIFRKYENKIWDVLSWRTAYIK